MEYLSVNQVATLRGCTVRQIQSLAQQNKLRNVAQIGSNNRKMYLIPLDALDPHLQAKYYRQQCGEVPPELQRLKRQKLQEPLHIKPLDAYTLDQRSEIERWTNIVTDWQAFRAGYRHKSDGDDQFIRQAKERYGIEFSLDILYRRLAALRSKNYDGLVDKRGAWRKGKSDAPQDIRDIFEYCFLDESALTVKKCVEATQTILRAERPQLLEQMPSYDTFWRWSKQLPPPVTKLARQGEKAFNDAYGLFVDRLYDDMASNDYWVADGHRIDVITRSEDGQEHQRRLTLSAFIDARSGIYVGWVVTDNPSSDATLLALRKAIQRYGIPRYLYVDNGREYLTTDIGGLGHRARVQKVKITLPTPILTRLGITMTNALPRNAQAKIIEREFKNFTFLSQLFETYCGSNVVAKPEKLKYALKAGRIPTDGRLCQVVDDMIEGYFNLQPYNGKVIKDKGKTKLEVYQSSLIAVRRAASDDLTLMMMRSTRLQTVAKNGVHITIGGERLYYFNDELLMNHTGQKVFVRYDPENLNDVRVYDEQEAFIMTAQLPLHMMLSYTATKDEISKAMAEKRRWHRLVKNQKDILQESVVSQYGHINMLDVFARAAHDNREGLLMSPQTNVVALVQSPERLQATGTSGAAVTIDMTKMIKNNEGRV